MKKVYSIILMLFFCHSAQLLTLNQEDEETILKNIYVKNKSENATIILKFNKNFTMQKYIDNEKGTLRLTFQNTTTDINKINNINNGEIIKDISIKNEPENKIVELEIETNPKINIKIKYNYNSENQLEISLLKKSCYADQAVILSTFLDKFEIKKKTAFPYKLLTHNGNFFPLETNRNNNYLTSTKFNKALNFVLSHEGGFANDPDDNGGETKYGISKKSYPHLNIEKLTLNEAKKIYRNDYWDPFDYDNINNTSIACKIFDLTVHVGYQSSHKLICRALCFLGYETEESEDLEMKTIKLINKLRAKDFISSLNKQTTLYYHEIVNKNPSQKKFLNGWLNRVNDNL